jgi:hypothetical protein
MAGERKPRLIAEMHGAADSVHLSPSGRWMAFTDTTSGRAEVSIVSFPGFTDKRQVSRGGGVQPIWRRDEKELFYLGANATIYAVSIQEGVSLTPGHLCRSSKRVSGRTQIGPVRRRRQRSAIPHRRGGAARRVSDICARLAGADASAMNG